MKNWKSVLFIIGIFILCQAILLVMVNKGRENDIELYVQKRLHSQEKEFQFILKSFAREAEIVFNEVFVKDEVVSLFAAAKNHPDNRSELRGRLYQRLLPAYQRLFSLGFRQVHFHFSDGTSFLRLHLPEKFGDSLFPFRESVRLANTEKRYVEGFEIGRNYHAFRYVFPITEAGVHIGTVEVSVPFYSVESVLQEVFNIEYHLLLKMEALDKKLTKEGYSNYVSSLLLQRYFHETDDLLEHKRTHNGHLELAHIIGLNQRLLGRIEKDIAERKNFAEAITFSGDDYLVTFLPLNDIGGEEVGYLISYERDTALLAIRQKMNVVHLVVGMFFCLFFYFHFTANKRKSEQIRFQQQVMEAIPAPVWLKAPGGSISGWNIAFGEMFDLSREDKDPVRQEDIWGEQSVVMQRMDKKALATQQVVKEEIGCRYADASHHVLVVQKVPLLDRRGRVITLIGSAFDISERKKTEELLLESYRELDQIFNTAANGMRIVDANHVIQRVNRAFCVMVDMSVEEIVGKKCYEILPGPNCETGECPLIRLASGDESFKTEMQKKMDSGQELECIVTAAPLCDGGGEFTGFVEDFQDVTLFRKMEKKLRDIAITDELTGVYNRRGFFLFAEKQIEAVRRNEQDAFVTYVDLDNLKTINDLQGHEAGDKAICAVGALLQKMFRKPDVVSRLGGDEFAVFTCCLAESSCGEAISRRLTQAVDEINDTGALPFELAISFGIARLGEKESLEQLVKQADGRMYQVKRMKKGKG